MKAWILYPSTTPKANNAFSWFTDAAARHGVELQVHFFEELSIEDLSAQESLSLDFVIMRGYDSELSAFFEYRGIPVYNSTSSMEASRNKVTTHRMLEANGIPTPWSLYPGSRRLGYAEICEHFKSDVFVTKQISGSKGENVYLIHDEAELKAAYEECRDRVFYQEFIASSCGRDVRVWVVGDEVVGCVLRHNEHSFKSNFAQGGGASPFELPEAAAEMAVRASMSLGLACSGVDLLFLGRTDAGEEQFTVCEVNGNAGFRTASLVDSRIDVPEKFIAWIVHDLSQPGLRK